MRRHPRSIVIMFVEIDLSAQHLTAYSAAGEAVMRARVSTAANGSGEENGSYCTPRGWHQIRAKIGGGLAENSVLVARRPTNEVYSASLRAQWPGRDWILTRILWLSGLEKNFNRLGSVDTMRRYIYIHGCPDDDSMGIRSSHGCVKMHNREVIELFNMVEVGTLVHIKETAAP